ncbi:peptidase inhibitor family I36 protein [Nocardia seriolae]|uniref:Peptidase inhibitor family I36 n=1 Tax=Nocardia seriolae TaxID=37332 RepID=A0A0B8N8K3_9NOCA|nr:peptidase inhibitor family I36 protein [Nocardia seriolae]APB00500.1 hypothetical protein NS506_06464 [Nocardia seriolae]MTJ62006.1 hypothetical protein [Nocardia seriolae]MTJ71117.1 hypothetical protein [Nocardia seriolae]MTJ89968.1 hypothetical protein [Nocardia seriolae]MTK33942.1 hypothetical protein [Nocardia seriolae]
MSIKKRLAGLAVGAAAVAASLAVAAPAHAASGFDRCPDGSICLFTQPNGGGQMVPFRIGAPDLRWVGIDKSTQSVWNRTGHYVTAFDDYRYRGNGTRFAPNEKRLTPAGFVSLANTSSLTVEVESAWYDRCPLGTLCLFDEPNGEGHMTVVRSSAPDLDQTRIDAHPVSLWNRTGGMIAFYDKTFYTGNSFQFVDNLKISASPVRQNSHSLKLP